MSRREFSRQRLCRSSSRERFGEQLSNRLDDRSPVRIERRADGAPKRVRRRRRSHCEEGRQASRRFIENREVADKRSRSSSSKSPWLNRIKMQSSSSSEGDDQEKDVRRGCSRSRHRGITKEAQASKKGRFDQVADVQKDRTPGGFDSGPERLQSMMNRMTQQQFGKMTLKMTQLQIRCLLGKNGATVQSVMRATGAQIHVKSPPQSPVGEVSLAGNIGPAMEMIKEILTTKGCPYSDGEYRSSASVIDVPEIFIGELIGPKAGLLLEIQARLGEDIVMQKHPYVSASGARPVQIAGVRWREAREIVAAWLDRKIALRRM